MSDEEKILMEKKLIDDRKRKRMVIYMAILFIVALLLVVLSFFVSARNSRNTISELNETSTYAMANAERLQEANQALTAENAELKAKLANLEEAGADAEASYEALLTAMSLLDSGDSAAARQHLAKVDPELLSATGQAIYPAAAAEAE